MDRIIAPLTDYDIFAYLMVGIAALAASDLVFGSRFLIRDEWSFGVGTMVIIAAYVAGQIVAAPSEWVLGRIVTHSLLKEPAYHLVMSKKDYEPFASNAKGFLDECNKRRREYDSLLFDTVVAYAQPLSCNLQLRIRQKEPNAQGRDLFSRAHSEIRNQEFTRDRLTTFSRLYIFCRNMSFVAFLAAFAVAIRARNRVKTKKVVSKRTKAGISQWLFEPRWQFIMFGAVGVALFVRYLFFYRLYSVEVLTAFAALTAAK